MTNSTRKSYITHLDSLDILDKLSDEQAGKLFKAIKFYQNTKKLPELDLMLDLVFTTFFNQFVRDDIKYENTCKARSLAGGKGGKQKVANASKRKQKVANLADSDSKSDSDSDSESENKNELSFEEKFESFWNLYDKKKSRPDAERKFKAALKNDTFENIMSGLEKYIKARSPDSQYWKHPSTWLHNECWRDDHTQATSSNSGFTPTQWSKY